MSNPTTPSFPDFGKLVPGFDFLQNLSKQAAGSAAHSTPQLSNLGNWIAPTLNVEELDKRIQELKSVQFWLDQNAAALKATLQALEVQKMTLATLKGMNFSMSEMANAFTLKASDSAASASQPDSDKAPPPPRPSPAAAAASAAAPELAKAEKSTDAASSFADPMKWWGALTQQFQVIAAQAMKETAKRAAPANSHNAAPEAVKAAAPARTARQPVAKTAAKTAARPAANPAVKSALNAAAKPGAQSVAKTTARATARPAVKPAVAPGAVAPGAAAPGAAAPARKAAARKTTR